MSRYLLTGVAGFIASRVTEFLLDAGHTVVGLDNINDAYDTRLKDWRLERLLGRPGFEFHKVDIYDRPALISLWDSNIPFDAVVNLAARAGVRQSIENPWVYFETNTTGTLNLLELCRTHGVKKFVLASTSSLYGLRNPTPFSEDADTSYPLSPYAASKKGAEALCYTYHHLYGIDMTVFRYFTVYGPAGRPDMSVFRFIQWISEGRPVIVFGDGQQSRDFTYVDDIAKGTIAGIRPLGYEEINLGGDKPYLLMDMIRLVEEKVGKKANLVFKPFHAADMQATWADISKAGNLLDWEPTVDFEHGIENTIQWYVENRDWAQFVNTD
jgi:UDP-glucuronate 4-epimerase